LFCLIRRTPSVDVFDQTELADINLQVAELVCALPVAMSAALLSSKIGITRLDSVFTRIFESSSAGANGGVFAAMNRLYGSASTGSASVMYAQWALRLLWWNQVSDVNIGLDNIEVDVIMVKAVNKLQFEDPRKFSQASLDAHAWCLEYMKKPRDESIIDPIAFFSSICKRWLDPTRLAGIGQEDVLTSILVYHMAAIASVSASKTATLAIIPSLVYSFPILMQSHISLVFGLITRSVLECIVLHFPKSPKYCCINGFLLNPSPQKDDSRPLTGRKSQWDVASCDMWEKAASHCINDVLDLILGLSQTNQADRYLNIHCTTLLLDILLSNGASPECSIRNRCFGLVSQPVFANILFTSGKRRVARKQACLDMVEACILEDGKNRRWACQLLAAGVERGDGECVEVVGRVRGVLVRRDEGDLVGKHYAVRCLSGAGNEKFKEEKEWLVAQVKGRNDQALCEFVMR
jgi:hypothetical protein